MDCVNHQGVGATAYCQNCGKALCAACARNAGNGQILCEPCFAAWQNMQQPFVAPGAGGPNPSVAAVLGIIPGVGAMYNGQYFKGLIHVVIFVVIISITTHYGLFGLFIPAWILYQSFEAFHTAKAIRDGQPIPDPLGLNEVGNWLNLGGPQHRPGMPVNPGVPGAGPATTNQGASGYQQVPYAAISGVVYTAAASRICRSSHSACASGATGFLAPQGADWRSDPDRIRIVIAAESDGLSGRACAQVFVAAHLYRAWRMADCPSL